MNQVNIIGNIGAEPKVTSFQSGKKKAAFSVALNSYSKDKENRPAPTWVHCEMWEATVDRLLKCKEKAKLTGRKIQITGSLALNVWTDGEGENQRTMKKLYVKVHSFELLSGLKSEAEPEIEEPSEENSDSESQAQVTTLPSSKARKRA